MLTVFVADEDTLKCIKNKILAQEKGNIQHVMINEIGSYDHNVWKFLNNKSNWMLRLRGNSINRLYIYTYNYSYDRFEILSQISSQMVGGINDIIFFSNNDYILNVIDHSIIPQPKPVIGEMNIILSYRYGKCRGCKWHPNVCDYCMNDIDEKF